MVGRRISKSIPGKVVVPVHPAELTPGSHHEEFLT